MCILGIEYPRIASESEQYILFPQSVNVDARWTIASIPPHHMVLQKEEEMKGDGAHQRAQVPFSEMGRVQRTLQRRARNDCKFCQGRGYRKFMDTWIKCHCTVPGFLG